MDLISAGEAKVARVKRDKTQSDVARIIGVASNTYSLWEGGKRNLPKGAHIALLS